MGFFERFMAMLPGERGNERSPLEERWWGQPGMISAAGYPVTPDQVEQLDVVQSCLENIAGSISTLPRMVYRRIASDADAAEAEETTDAESDLDREPIPDHPLLALLNNPNGQQTAQEFFDEMLRHLAFHRNFYAEIVPTDATPYGELQIIHPLRVYDVKRIGDRVFYRFRGLDGVTERVLPEDRIWHIRKAPLTRDGLRGRPIYEYAKETFGKAIAAEDYGAKFFKNGTDGDAIELPNNVTFKSKEDEDTFIRAITAGRSGLNRHRTWLLKNGAKLNRSIVENDKAQFIETVKQNEIKICRLWLMPPHRVGVLDRATFSNIEQQSVEFVVYCLSPFIVAVEQSLAKMFGLGPDEFIELNVAGLLRGDLKSLYEGFAQARQWGWLSVNDIRRMLNKKGIGPAGDIYLQPVNMVRAGTVAPSAPSPEPTQP